jgi:hypothetical protein
MQPILRLSGAVVLYSIVTACGGGGGGDGSTGPVAVADVRVTAPATVFEGATAQAQAVVLDGSGSPLSGRSVSWSSSNDAIATVNSSGMISGVTSGTATIRATSGGKTGSSDITVSRDPAVASITLTPLVASIQSRGTLALTVVVKNAHGQELPNQAVTYTSSNAAVATVSQAGVVTSVGPVGVANIVAGVGSVSSAPSVLTVTPGSVSSLVKVADVPASPVVGSTNAVSVKATDAAGNPIAGTQVSFGVTSGTGSITPSATTDASGIAVASFTLGTTVGPNTAIANVAALGGAGVTFSATTVAAAPAHLDIKAGNNQTAPVGSIVPVPPTVALTDTYGNPVAGTLVSFGTSTDQTGVLALVSTDANGVAQDPHWVLLSVGANTLYVTAAGMTLQFTATGY